MRYRKITVNTALDGGEATEECMEVEIEIGEHTYKVSERDDALHVRVDGGLFVEPIANNCVSIKEGK